MLSHLYYVYVCDHLCACVVYVHVCVYIVMQLIVLLLCAMVHIWFHVIVVCQSNDFDDVAEVHQSSVVDRLTVE